MKINCLKLCPSSFMPAPKGNKPAPLRQIQTIDCVKPVEDEAFSILETFWRNILSEFSGSITWGNGLLQIQFYHAALDLL